MGKGGAKLEGVELWGGREVELNLVWGNRNICEMLDLCGLVSCPSRAETIGGVSCLGRWFKKIRVERLLLRNCARSKL